MEISNEELEAWDGLAQSYDEMAEKLEKAAPRCHMRPMSFDSEGGESWWECEFCGHVKPFEGAL